MPFGIHRKEDNLTQVKNYNISKVVLELGLKIYQGGLITCVNKEHNDSHPSCRLYTDSNKFYCYTCGVKGSTIDLVMYAKDVHFPDAVKYIEEIMQTPTIDETAKEFEKLLNQSKPYEHEDLKKTHLKFLLDICGELSNSGRSYLYNRGLDKYTLAVFQITDVKDSTERLLRSQFPLDDLKKTGLINHYDTFVFNAHRLLFPFFKDTDSFYMQARTLFLLDKKYKNLSGGIPYPYNYNVLKKESDKLYITESIIDGLSLFMMKCDNFIATTGVNFKQEWFDYLLKFKKIFICYDNDEAGINRAIQLREKLVAFHSLNIHIKIPPDPFKDWNEYYVYKSGLKN